LMPSLNAYATLVLHRPLEWLFSLSHKLTWCWGPIVVVLIQKILLERQNSRTLLLHAMPFIIAATGALFKWQWIDSPFMVLLLFVQVFGYLFYTLWLLQKNRSLIVKVASQYKNTTYYWLLYLVAGLFFIMLFDVTIYARIYQGVFPSPLLIGLVASLLAMYVNTIALFAVYQPKVFFQEPDSCETGNDLIPEAPSAKPSLRSIELSSDAAKELNEQLLRLVDSHKPHLDDTISLAKLASLLGVTTHQLSELLNIHNGTSFYDFLNELRYQESLKILHNHQADLTIADIAYQSGFNNRNSFYNVFKEKTGVTPSQYKKSAR
ncbi:MAG: AraC family transcriptional regulator, partial [Moraxellaceae bacterium]